MNRSVGGPGRVRRIFIAALLVIGASAQVFAADESMTNQRVGANLVFWDQARGIDTIVANLDVITEVSPFWYRVLADGSVEPYRTAAGNTYEDWAFVSHLQGRGITVMATVANVLDGNWDGPLVSRIIADPQLAAANINALVDLAVGYGYDGIDLDYEDLKAADRAAFTAFVRDLATALHARGKLLAVDVYAKTGEPGTWDGPMAQDWRSIGQYADHVKIMAYEYHWSTSKAGAIAPVQWVNDVLAFARTTVPAHKITHGLPLYGYDWIGTSGTAVVWEQAIQLSQKHGAAIQWDSATAAPWFQYAANGRQHTVWFENAKSADAKLALAARYAVGGVNLWRLGGEDRAVWAALRTSSPAVREADIASPTVAITSLTDGAVLKRKQKLSADAADDVAVTKVEFYVDGQLLATDTSSPYATYWTAPRRLPSGLKTFTAVAYDAAGNTGVAQVTALVP